MDGYGALFTSYAWAFLKIFLGWLWTVYGIATIIYFFKNKKEFKKLGFKKVVVVTIVISIAAIVLAHVM